ncbi:MAG: NUDIX domain-containing protein [Candidatus Woesearchaeota archaeon]
MDEKELLDVVDESDVVIQRGVPRSEVHAKNYIHRAVMIFVFNKKGQIFVQQRSNTKDRYPGLWMASASGHVRSGESYDAAAVRELKEELGISVSAKRLERVCDFDVMEPIEREQDVLYVLDEFDGEIKLDRQEVLTGKWMSINELRKEIVKDEKKWTPPFLTAWKLWMAKTKKGV